jgi:hypothetical protein
MGPFRDYQQIIAALARHCPFGGCAVCRSEPALVWQELIGLVGRSWTVAELDLLSKAARSALL